MKKFIWFISALIPAMVFAAEEFNGSNLRYYYPVPKAEPAKVIDVDVCAYGGTPAGVTAAIQAKRLGKSAALVVFNKHVGGMTSGGLTATDLTTVKAIGGMAIEFYDRIGKPKDFLPADAEKTFLAMLKEAEVPIYYEHRLKSVTKDGNALTEIEFENGNRFRAKMFIDATYEGDLLAQAGVSFHVGREANSVYDEKMNGIQFHAKYYQFPCPIDPYRVEGDPKSGLLWGISDEAPGKEGEADPKIQAFNFRWHLSTKKDRLPFSKPKGYDPSWYVLLGRYLKKLEADPTLIPSNLPMHNRYVVQLRPGDANNAGPFSTDFIGGNARWPEAGYEEREKIFQEHVKYQQGLMYFLVNDESVPPSFREKFQKWGLSATAFPETGGWPHQLYIREGRRMVSAYVMTEHNCRSKVLAEDSVGLASYPMDSHYCRRLVIDGQVKNEGQIEMGCPQPYPVSYRSIIPKEEQCANLLVPVCLSASHVAYGSIRMEPVFMILGQSAAAAAVIAIDEKSPVQKVNYAKLREQLLAQKQILAWTEVPRTQKKK